jgi:hypothetical protein
MKKLFPIRRDGPPPKEVVCEAMTPNMKPTLSSNYNKIVTFPNPTGSDAKSNPVILNFPVRAL